MKNNKMEVEKRKMRKEFSEPSEKVLRLLSN